jgi:hypothetical protein
MRATCQLPGWVTFTRRHDVNTCFLHLHYTESCIFPAFYYPGEMKPAHPAYQALVSILWAQERSYPAGAGAVARWCVFLGQQLTSPLTDRTAFPCPRGFTAYASRRYTSLPDIRRSLFSSQTINTSAAVVGEGEPSPHPLYTTGSSNLGPTSNMQANRGS